MNRKILLINFVAIVFTSFILFGCSTKAKKLNERHYQTILCNELNGKMEYVLKDKTRVDCLTDTYAIEVDFAKKWAEGIGQSLYYAQMTSKKPAIALIVADNEDRFVKRLKKVTDKFMIKVFIIEK